MDKIKIIIDTDIGDDADDALAICLALKSEELEVMGITTVFRNTAARAQIAVRLLQLMGRTDIPVYAGIGHPLVAEADVETVPIQLLAGMEELEYRKDMDGVEYLRRSLSASQGDITLVTIGPLTNVGVLLCKHPEVKGKIKEIVMMGGAYYMHYNEWNILCDPEAAHIVYSSGVPIRAIGLDKHSLRQSGNLARRDKRVHLRIDRGGNVLPVDGNGLPFLQDLSEAFG